MGYILKHIKLFKDFFIFSFKYRTEYKFQNITSLMSHISVALIWIFFWDLIFSNIEAIGHWNFPMLLMMVGFLQLANPLFQMFYYVVFFQRDLMNGNIDKYLVRPINPLYALIMSNLSVEGILPMLFGVGIFAYVLTFHLSSTMLLFFLGLFCCLMGVMIWLIMNLIIGSLTFWFGITTSLGGLYRSFYIGNTFPLDVLSIFLRGVYTFVFPGIFLGTYPVLIATKWGLPKTLKILGLEFVLLLFWGFVLYILWKKGVRRYESFGG